jgi:hypothetical protein
MNESIAAAFYGQIELLSAAFIPRSIDPKFLTKAQNDRL